MLCTHFRGASAVCLWLALAVPAWASEPGVTDGLPADAVRALRIDRQLELISERLGALVNGQQATDRRLTDVEARLRSLEALREPAPARPAVAPANVSIPVTTYLQRTGTVVLSNNTEYPAVFQLHNRTLRLLPFRQLELKNQPTGAFTYWVTWPDLNYWLGKHSALPEGKELHIAAHW